MSTEISTNGVPAHNNIENNFLPPLTALLHVPTSPEPKFIHLKRRKSEGKCSYINKWTLLSRVINSEWIFISLLFF